MKYCKKNNIKIITHIVDWIPESKGNIFIKIGKYIDSNYRIRYINKKSDGIIVVSNFFYNYYIKYCKNVIVIPPLIDLKKFPKFSIKYNKSKIKLVYFGEPFPVTAKKCRPSRFKDRIDIVVDMLCKLGFKNYSLDIFGISKQEYLKFMPNDKKRIRNTIKFYGKITRDELLKKVMEYDFLIFLRESNKVTQAGFPSKISEAFGCGLPVITTQTSDINQYINDGRNGFIIGINDIEKLKEILRLDRKTINRMKENVVKSNRFDYHHYIDKFSKFMERL